jgi:hypothetical protein
MMFMGQLVSLLARGAPTFKAQNHTTSDQASARIDVVETGFFSKLRLIVAGAETARNVGSAVRKAPFLGEANFSIAQKFVRGGCAASPLKGRGKQCEVRANA